MIAANPAREELVRRGLRLEYVTVGYNALEGLIGILAGLMAGSVALVGFAVDSLIEVSSGLILIWRLHSDRRDEDRERVERRALRLVGISFLILAAWVAWESGEALWRSEAPQRSLPGIVLALASLLVMPVLARQKRRVGRDLSSGAMVADSRQTELCFYLSIILLSGLALNAMFGWWWADPAAGLAMVPIIVNEGVQALQGKSCSDCH